ncbi:cytochrome b [Magnetospira sp. QH-2]|uniref:cytochrome b n=1 Tax=Magnetospira sp. (strain QH-2) TaxID=1288970 RepID=UPI0003E8137E|nr:cytochrome b/b6 domain-containing protein [Magnetospira sp. QH-2]CCQ72402.1 Di-haem transmembrane cytochrome (cytochrome b561) [Magnetospira sp. QH-2]
MQFSNHPSGYGLVAIVIHWTFAVTLLGLFGLGLYMVELTYYHPWYRSAPDLHRSVGVVLALLWLVRILWRMTQARVLPEPGAPAWETRVAHMVHGLLYLLPLGLFVSGYLISTADGRAISFFNLFDIPALLPPAKGREDWAGDVHFAMALAVVSLAALHALAALKHHMVERDRTLVRMLKPLESKK